MSGITEAPVFGEGTMTTWCSVGGSIVAVRLTVSASGLVGVVTVVNFNLYKLGKLVS